MEHGLTKNQTLRLEFQTSETATTNAGVGGFNLPERAYDNEGNTQQLRAQLQGVIRKTMLHEVRLQVNTTESAQTSLSTAPTIVVLDPFTRGGAGIANDGSSRTLELAQNLDVNVGRTQQMRVGYLLEGGEYRNFDARNAAGTFTFSSLDDFHAGTPATFTQRIGQVDTRFTQYT
jgi:hypothetical protein